jgi:chromosome segregation ATPase
MDAIDPAARRLDAALRRLEAALEAHLSNAAEAETLRAEIAALVDDRAGLAAALDSSQARAAELEALADQASSALGDAIAEVRGALGKED